ncbi:hypothetical protein J2751_003115 [Halorubrum alkaliphilum]|uniref:Uncharacterized protein n=1 Tax=Halorubrum alkaliphilum TaxID=261290 RepID=A0A8T4GM61_9EURY|nr:hypothetical protein [Halorubrum alkaliphilum]
MDIDWQNSAGFAADITLYLPNDAQNMLPAGDFHKVIQW